MGNPEKVKTTENVDGSTDSLININYEHHEIHSGSHFFYSDCVVLGIAGTQQYLITTPDTEKQAHFLFSLVGSSLITLNFFEDGDRVGTTPQVIKNNNRNSVKTSTLSLHKGTGAGTTDGTDIHFDCGGGNKQTGVISRNQEIILKSNTKYIIKVTSSVNNNSVSVNLNWYEHTPKN